MALAVCRFCEVKYKVGRAAYGYYCSVNCHSLHRSRRIWQAKVPEIEAGRVGDRPSLKRYVTGRDGYQCALCSISSWMEQPLSLQLDHTDGNPGNNFPSNLRLLCANCHSQTPFYAGRNKGNGRKSRGIKRG